MKSTAVIGLFIGHVHVCHQSYEQSQYITISYKSLKLIIVNQRKQIVPKDFFSCLFLK